MTKLEFDDWVLEDGKDILRFCRMLAGQTLEGDELYQDTMLKLLEQKDKLERKQNIKSYALSVSLLLWKNRRRKFAWRNRLAPLESYEQHMEHSVDHTWQGKAADEPEQRLLRDEEIQIVRKAVSGLEEKYRTVLYLYYSAEMKYREISTCLHIPESTVKSRMRKAKKLLKKELEAMKYER